jgi:uncharacterized protein (TIGR02996 family)
MSHQVFLQAICADPDDDAPRLVYADWLDDHGEADRAAFIRDQCELARLGVPDSRHADYYSPTGALPVPPPPGSRRSALEASVARLLKKHERAWVKPLHRPFQLHRWEFHRGFVAYTALTAARFLRQADELFALTPVQAVELSGVSRHLRALVGCPALARLRGLNLWHNGLVGDQVRAILASPHLARLEALNLYANRLDNGGAAALAEGAPEGLGRLDLSGNEIGDRGVIALAGSPRLAGLVVLHLGWNSTGPTGARALADSPHLRSLTRLSLGMGRTTLGDEGATALAASPHLRRLAWLHLGGCGLSDAAAEALAASLHLSGLRALHLNHNGLGDDALLALAGSPSLAGLEELNLMYNRVGNGGALDLARSPHLHGLKALSLHANRVGDPGVRALASSPQLAGLAALDLSHNPFGDSGALALAASPHLAGLATLRLIGLEVSGNALQALRDRFGAAVCFAG